MFFWGWGIVIETCIVTLMTWCVSTSKVAARWGFGKSMATLLARAGGQAVCGVFKGSKTTGQIITT